MTFSTDSLSQTESSFVKPIFSECTEVFLASQDALEVMGVSHSLTESLSGR